MSTTTAAAGNERPGNTRWAICALLFFSVAVNYIDRLVIGILKKPLSAELGWSDADYGHIAAAFSFAYAFGYLFGGRLIDRFGVKKGLPVFVFLWSLAAAAHGLCGYIGIKEQFRASYPWFSLTEGGFAMATLVMPMTAAGFMFARIALGLTEGGNFPGAIKTVAEWFPVKERALATGLFNAGTNVGAIVCPILVPWMYSHIGWESTFYVTGGTGFVWIVLWKMFYDEPDQHPRLSKAELDHIRSGQPAVEEVPVSVPWLSLFRYRAVWAYLLASIFAGPAWGFYQFFLPDFLDKKFHLSLQATGWWTGAFFGIAAAGGVAGGWLVARFLGLGWSLNRSRKMTLLVCALAVGPPGMVGKPVQCGVGHDAEGRHQFRRRTWRVSCLLHGGLRQRIHRPHPAENRKLPLGVRVFLLDVSPLPRSVAHPHSQDCPSADFPIHSLKHPLS
jgi:ACS family hexuronate transporter-like MFS transporter